MKVTLLLSLLLSLSLNATCTVDGHNAPKWACEDFTGLDTQTNYYSVAKEHISRLGMRFTKSSATSNARAKMARELHGVTKGNTTITNTILTNSRISNSWSDSKSNMLYVLLEAPKKVN